MRPRTLTLAAVATLLLVGAYLPRQSWQVGTATTTGAGTATVVFPAPFASGLVPVVHAEVIAPAGSTSSYSAQLTAVPTSTGFTVRVNAQPASISLAGLLSLTPFAAAPAGVQVQWAARAP